VYFFKPWGPGEEAAGPLKYELTSITVLNYELDKYIGKNVTLVGYFGHGSFWGESNASFLVLDYRILASKKPLVYGTWVRLNGNVPPVDYEGSLIQIEGVVKSYNQVYGNVSSYDVPLITVENYYVIEKANTTLKSIKPSIPVFKAPLLQGQKKVKPCDRAVIISGGIDDHNNNEIFRIEIREIYNKLKSLGFKDNQITVIYYNGRDFTVNRQKIHVDKSATKRNIIDVFNNLLRDMDPCCTLYIFVTDHGFGYDAVKGDSWRGLKARTYDPSKKPDPLTPTSGDPGKHYSERELIFNCKPYKAKGMKWPSGSQNPRWTITYEEYTKTFYLWKKKNNKWKVEKIAKDRDGDGKISESEFSIDIDGNPNNNLKFDPSSFTIDCFHEISFEINLDGTNKKYKVVYDFQNRKCQLFINDGGTWKKIAEDTDGDNIIEGIDLNNNGNTNDEYTFHEAICLYRGELLWDYELAQILKRFHDKGVHIYVMLSECFSGGFVENLNGMADIIATGAGEDRTATIRSRKPYPERTLLELFIDKLQGLTVDGWKRAFSQAEPPFHSDSPEMAEAPKKPDFIVTSITIYSETAFICVGETDIFVNVRNVGWKATSNVKVTLYINGKKIGIQTINEEIKPNEEKTIQFKYNFNKLEIVTVKAVVNEEKDIEEVWYDNNEKEISFEVKGAELTYEKVTMPKGKIRAGDEATFKVIVVNNGPCAAQNFKVKFQITGEAYSGEQLVQVSYSKEEIVTVLNPSEKTTLEFKYRFELPGKYTIKIVIDSDNVVVESNEDNNVYEKTITVYQKQQIPGGG
ncbi:MAG TPA: hypothetical protein ENF63_01905, partial [Candidatus Bathyarchaeota archaeon]|nr:hypothetical protein [Candidatus Bathyarchaeota archaeon]